MSERFSLALSIAAIRDGDRVDLTADENECATIAKRLNVPAVGALKAHAVLERVGDSVKATGRLKANLEQSCVASGEPIATSVDEPFELHFQPEPNGRPDEEIELRADDLDVIFHDGSVVPLGDALIDTLALALDPFPRGPNATSALHEAGVLSEEEAGPFAALAALKRDKGDA